MIVNSSKTELFDKDIQLEIQSKGSWSQLRRWMSLASHSTTVGPRSRRWGRQWSCVKGLGHVSKKIKFEWLSKTMSKPLLIKSLKKPSLLTSIFDLSKLKCLILIKWNVCYLFNLWETLFAYIHLWFFQIEMFDSYKWNSQTKINIISEHPYFKLTIVQTKTWRQQMLADIGEIQECRQEKIIMRV